MLIALLLVQSAATVEQLPSNAAGDARCMVVLSFIGSRGTPDQAEAAKRGILYFAGKLRGRDPAVDIGTTVARAADAARAAGLDARAEAQRCNAEIESAGEALRGIRGAVTAPRP